MDSLAVKEAVKSLIGDNANTLLDGLVHQGQQRLIKRISRSHLTPLVGYYYIAMRIPIWRGMSRPESVKTQRNPTRKAEYELEIYIADAAQIQPGEDAQYEQMHGDGETFANRVADLLESQTWIGSSPKLRLKRQGEPVEGDRLVQIEDRSENFFETERNGVASLLFVIFCTLEQGCVDNATLYD